MKDSKLAHLISWYHSCPIEYIMHISITHLTKWWYLFKTHRTETDFSIPNLLWITMNGWKCGGCERKYSYGNKFNNRGCFLASLAFLSWWADKNVSIRKTKAKKTTRKRNKIRTNKWGSNIYYNNKMSTRKRRLCWKWTLGHRRFGGLSKVHWSMMCLCINSIRAFACAVEPRRQKCLFQQHDFVKLRCVVTTFGKHLYLSNP